MGWIWPRDHSLLTLEVDNWAYVPSCYTGRKKSGNGLPRVGRVQVRVAASPREVAVGAGSLVSVPS